VLRRHRAASGVACLDTRMRSSPGVSTSS
jgi:hypothetical protein